MISHKEASYLQEGLRRTIDSYPHLRADVRSKRDGPSKAELLLGSGKGMNLFLSTLLCRTFKIQVVQ